jgi:hypothetical protein
VEGELPQLPEDPSETPFEPDVADVELEEDDALLDLFGGELEDIHPRLGRTRNEGWFGGDDVA